MRDILGDLEQGNLLSDPDPVRRAQIQMLEPLPKRFYKDVTVGEGEDGYTILLDGKLVRTPGRGALALPTCAAAQLVAGEFAAQVEVINPLTMPVMRLANSALDGVAHDLQSVADDIVKFCGSDMICYRADSPARLVELASAAWDPILAWLASAHGARFLLASGIIHVEQPGDAVAAFRAAMSAYDDALKLACLHSMTTLTGSAMIALGLAEGFLTADQAWAAAHVDEDWTISQWGEDEEAQARRIARRKEFDAAVALLSSLA